MAEFARYLPLVCFAIFIVIYWSRISAAFTAGSGKPASQPVAAPTPIAVSPDFVQQVKTALELGPEKQKDPICGINMHFEPLIEDARTRGDQALIDHLLVYYTCRVAVSPDTKSKVQ